MSITSTFEDIRKTTFDGVNDAQDLILDLHRTAAESVRAAYAALLPESAPGRGLVDQQLAFAREVAAANLKFAKGLAEVWLPTPAVS